MNGGGMFDAAFWAKKFENLCVLHYLFVFFYWCKKKCR